MPPIIIELEEEDSALVDFDLALPFLWGSACAEEAASDHQRNDAHELR